MSFKGFSVGVQNDSEKIKQLVLQSKQIADDLESLQSQIQELSTSKTSGSGGLPVVGNDSASYLLDLANCTSLYPLVIDKNKRKIQSIESVPMANSVLCHGLDFYLAADQSISSGVWSKIPFDTVRSGSPALLSSGSYVCQAAGWYHVDIQTRFLYVNNTTSCYLAIYKNTASEVNTIEKQFEASGSPYLHISLAIYCAAGDTISGYVYHNFGSARNIQGGKGITRMSVVRQGI